MRETVHAHRTAFTEQQQEIHTLQALAARIGTPALRSHAAQRQAFLHLQRGDWPQAVAAGEDALALAGPADMAEAARAHNTLLGTLLRQGRHDQARHHGQAGLPLAQAAGDTLTQAHLLNNLALEALDTGRLDDALALCAQAEAVYAQAGSRWGAAYALANHGLACYEAGLFDEACERLQAALQLCAEVGNRAPAVIACNNLANALLELGDALAAQRAALDGLERARAVGDRFLVALAHDAAGAAALVLGQPDDAAQHFDSGAALCQELGAPRHAQAMRAGAARVALARGEHATARAGVSAAADAYLGGASTQGNLSILADLLEVLAAVGDARSDALLVLAHAELLRVAGLITEPGLRATFMNTSRVRRSVLQAWAASGRGLAPG